MLCIKVSHFKVGKQSTFMHNSHSFALAHRVQVEYNSENTFKERLQLFFIKNRKSSKCLSASFISMNLIVFSQRIKNSAKISKRYLLWCTCLNMLHVYFALIHDKHTHVECM